MSIEGDFFWAKFFFLIAFVQRVIESNSDVGCLSTQYVELGRQGYITCTFPTHLSEVYWYDDVSGGSDVLAIAVYRVGANVKEGPGIDSGEYNILPNGTLVITNVSIRYEKKYRVLACTQRCNPLPTISVKVVVYPRAPTPTIAFCNGESPCTVTVTKAGHPTCQVDSARPPVDLEWMWQISGKDIHVEGQVSFSVRNSDGATYKSIAVLNETINIETLLAVYNCKPRWIIAGFVTERKVIVDYSNEQNLLNLPLEGTVYYEVNRRSELRCKVSNFSAIIWKKVGSSGTVKTIGFIIDNMIHTNGDLSDSAILSLDGSLQFRSLQLHHEGTYACIYDKGKGVKGTQKRYLHVLVPPSPPYIKIKECQYEPCIFRSNRSGSLTCVIHGVRPNVSLTWVGMNDNLVTLQDESTESQNRGILTDVSTSVYYEISYDIVCGTSVELICQIGLPISQIIQPYVTAVIYPDECIDGDGGGTERNSIHITLVVSTVMDALCILTIVIALFSYLKFRRDCTKDWKSNRVSLCVPAPNEHVMHTLDNKKQGNEQRKDETEIILTNCGGNGAIHEGSCAGI